MEISLPWDFIPMVDYRWLVTGHGEGSSQDELLREIALYVACLITQQQP